MSFERALEIDPYHPGAHLNLALVLQRRGDAARAQVHMQRFRALSEVAVGEERKRVRVTALLRSAEREIEAGNLDAALASALAALEAGPEFAPVHAVLGRVWGFLGRAEDAARAQATAERLAETSK